MEEKDDKRALGAPVFLSAFVGTFLLALLAVVVGHALLRGPLTTEALTRSLFARVPRALGIAAALVLAAPGLWAAFRAKGSRLDRAFAVAVALFGVLVVVLMDRAGPRRAFDAWERSFTATALGIPWSAVLGLVLSALVALATGRALRAWLVARGAPASGRLDVQSWLVAVALFVVPAAAVVYVTTGTRILPGIEPDETWAPAFVDVACPPRAGAGEATGAARAPSPSSAPSASAPKP